MPFVDPRTLVTLRRYDLAAKYRFFCHLLRNDDPDSERIYREHILARSGARIAAKVATDGWKLAIDDYVASATGLVVSMRRHGFLPHGAVPIDPNGELLGGAHRVACAIACEIAEIPVAVMNQYFWAPTWNRDWFITHGISEADLAGLDATWQQIQDSN
jgi:hypothetical protein